MASPHDGTYEIGAHPWSTRIVIDDGEPRLPTIAGWTTSGRAGAPRTLAGISTITVDGRAVDRLKVSNVSQDETGLTVTCDLVGTALLLKISLGSFQGGQIVERSDVLVNSGSEPLVVNRALCRIGLSRGRYELYSQESRWSGESQGSFRDLGGQGAILTHIPGRTTEGAVPFAVFRRLQEPSSLALHVLPRGNWIIRTTALPAGGDLPYRVIELGLADRDLHLGIPPGGELRLPTILFQGIPADGLVAGAPTLHRHILFERRQAKPAESDRTDAPVVYNTWFDQFDQLDVPRLSRQVAAAKDLGCEVFVVDAGWYGGGGATWSTQTGDWRENPDAAFKGAMAEFAEGVRSSGLGFGLWMEPERFCRDAPIRRLHPEWFVGSDSAARIDLEQRTASDYLDAEIRRLVETYELAWMKVDFNFGLGYDAGGSELSAYYGHWYDLLDGLRADYPDVYFEGCASGAMRCEIESVAHFDGHFLSDTVNPLDMVRISESTLLRLPPGKLTRWAVIRSGGRVIPRYGKPVAQSPAAVLAPAGALWEPAETVDVEFALTAAMPGHFGLSGDLLDLSNDVRASVSAAVSFYKRHRRLIRRSVGRLLTPPESLQSRNGWSAVQLDGGSEGSLVFVYRLGQAGDPPSIRLAGLDPLKNYRLFKGFGEEDSGLTVSGASLSAEGLPFYPDPPAGARGSSALVLAVRQD